MSAESTLDSLLTSYSPLISIVPASRIFSDAMPEDTTYPAIIFTRAATEPVGTIHATRIAEFVGFQIDCWGKDRTSADAVVEKVEAALLAAGELPENRSGGYDAETGLYYSQTQVTILHNF